MKQKSYNLSPLLLCAVLMAGIVSTFPLGAQATSTTKANLTVWCWDDNFNVSIMRKAGEVYAKTHPGFNINVVSLSKQDTYTKLQTGLASGGKGLPDIVLVEDYVIGKYLRAYPKSFADLSNAINYKDFLDFKTAAVSYKGRQYGVPQDTGPTSLFYRLDLIKRAGYTEADMQDLTWDRFIEIGTKVTKITGVKMYVQIASNRTSEVRVMMQSAGLWYYNDDGSINIKNNPAIKEAFRIIKKMKDTDILYEAESDGDRAGALNRGAAASIINGPWFVGTLKAAQDQMGLWRVAPTPRLSSLPSKNASNVGGGSWYVLEKSPNKDVAIDFLKTIFDGNEGFYQDILVNNGCVSSYKASLKGPVFEKGDEFFGGEKIFQSFADTLGQVQGINYGGYVAEANDAINTVIVGYLKGQTTLDEALNQADKQLRNQLQ